MSTDHFSLLTCPSCGDHLSVSGEEAQVTPACPRCQRQQDPHQPHYAMGDVLNEVWSNLAGLHTWGQVVGWAILCATTFIPVMVLWGSSRLDPDEPLLPVCLAISMFGGAVGMSLLYPKKGYRLPGLLAGPLFGPGVFLAFWLLAGDVMNKLILLGLVLLGGGPSYALYVYLLYRRARQG